MLQGSHLRKESGSCTLPVSQFPTSIFSLDSCCPHQVYSPPKIVTLAPSSSEVQGEHTPLSFQSSRHFAELHFPKAVPQSKGNEEHYNHKKTNCSWVWHARLSALRFIIPSLFPLLMFTLHNTTLPGAACAGLHIQVLVCATASLRMPSPPL